MEGTFTLSPAAALAFAEKARLEGRTLDDVVNQVLREQCLCVAQAAGLTDPRFDHGPHGHNRRLSDSPKFPH